MSGAAETAFSADDEPSARAEPRNPFFDIPDNPNALDCLDAISRASCAVELLNYLKLGEADEELSCRAVSGYWWLTEALSDTLTFSVRRLQTLNQERRRKELKKNRYLSALLTSFSIVGNSDRDDVLNAMARKLQVARCEIDAFMDDATVG